MDDMPSSIDLAEKMAKLQKDGDEAFRHLCAVLSLIEEREALPEGGLALQDLPKEVQKWWKQHKKADAKRIKREKIEVDIRKLQEELSKL